jgi:hypothetical protein
MYDGLLVRRTNWFSTDWKSVVRIGFSTDWKSVVRIGYSTDWKSVVRIWAAKDWKSGAGGEPVTGEREQIRYLSVG